MLPNSVSNLAFKPMQETLLKSSFDIVIKSTNLDFVLRLQVHEIISKNGPNRHNRQSGFAGKKLVADEIIDNGSFFW